MSNAHVNHHIAVALGPYMPRRTESDYRSRAVLPKPQRVFDVAMSFDGEEHQFNLLADNTVDAICKALDLFLSKDSAMPADGLVISCKPAAKAAP